MKKPNYPIISTIIGSISILFGIKAANDLRALGLDEEASGEGIFLLIGFVIIGIAWFFWYRKYQEYDLYMTNQEAFWKKRAAEAAEAQRKRDAENAIIQAEKEAAIRSQTSGSPWERYYTHPCPYCGHYKVRPANWDDKRMSVAFWGAASSKIGTRYKCENCNKMWS